MRMGIDTDNILACKPNRLSDCTYIRVYAYPNLNLINLPLSLNFLTCRVFSFVHTSIARQDISIYPSVRLPPRPPTHWAASAPGVCG